MPVRRSQTEAEAKPAGQAANFWYFTIDRGKKLELGLPPRLKIKAIIFSHPPRLPSPSMLVGLDGESTPIHSKCYAHGGQAIIGGDELDATIAVGARSGG